MWKRLSKVKARLKSATSTQKLAKLLQDRHELEQQLHEDYTAMNFIEEDQAFFSFAKSRQKTKSKVGPFIDCTTGLPNPSPEFAAAELSKQYSSVFVSPRDEWKVEDPVDFFSSPDIALTDPVMADISFTEEDIIHSCAELILK